MEPNDKIVIYQTDDGQMRIDVTDEATALIDVVMNYNYALDTLDNYDYERLKINATTKTKDSH